jgi:hypothetical protein
MVRTAAHRRSTNILGSGLGRFLAGAAMVLSGLSTKAQIVDTRPVAHNDTTKTSNAPPGALQILLDAEAEADNHQLDVEEASTDIGQAEIVVASTTAYSIKEPSSFTMVVKKTSNRSQARRRASYIESISQNESLPRIAGRLGMQSDDLAGHMANLVQIESGFNPHARNPDTQASGYYQYMNSTRQGLIRRLGLYQESAAATSIDKQIQLDHKLYLSGYLSQNLDFADRFVAERLEKAGVQEFYMMDELGRETKVENINDPRFKLAIAFWCQYGTGNWDEVVRNTGVFGERIKADGTPVKYFSMSSICPEGKQNGFTHFCAAGYEQVLNQEDHSPTYYKDAALSKSELKANFLKRGDDASQVDGLHPAFAIRLWALLKNMPKAYWSDVHFNDGFRTYEEQQDRKDTYGSGAAKPGTSHHEFGFAADLHHRGRARTWIHKNAPKYGLGHPLNTEARRKKGKKLEPWHIEYVGDEQKFYVRGIKYDGQQMLAAERGLDIEVSKTGQAGITKSGPQLPTAESIAAALEANEKAGPRTFVVTAEDIADSLAAHQAVAADVEMQAEEEGETFTYLYEVSQGAQIVGSIVISNMALAADAVVTVADSAFTGWTGASNFIYSITTDDPWSTSQKQYPDKIDGRERGADGGPPQQLVVLEDSTDTSSIQESPYAYGISTREASDRGAGPVELINNEKVVDSTAGYKAGDVVDLSIDTQPGYAPGVTVEWDVSGQQIVVEEPAADMADVPEVVVAKKFKQNKDTVCSDMFRNKYFGQKITIEGVGECEITEEFVALAQEVYGGKVANAVIARAINNFEKRSTQDIAERPDLCAISAKSKLAQALAPTPAQPA